MPKKSFKQKLLNLHQDVLDIFTSRLHDTPWKMIHYWQIANIRFSKKYNINLLSPNYLRINNSDLLGIVVKSSKEIEYKQVIYEVLDNINQSSSSGSEDY